MAGKLAISPAVEAVSNVCCRIPDDGLVNVGVEVFEYGNKLLGRWAMGGVTTVLEDIKFATNWEGMKGCVDKDSDGDSDNNSDGDGDDDGDINSSEPPTSSSDDCDYLDSDKQPKVANPKMPCCPITGAPMIIPVVAADGHTYEKRAILKWFAQSDMSPLTGTEVLHKEVVTNFSLIDSLKTPELKCD